MDSYLINEYLCKLKLTGLVKELSHNK